MTPVDSRILATARSWLLDAYARDLAPGEVILQTVDTYWASGKITLQAPVDPEAEFIFREPLKVQPGGITESIAYVKTKDRAVREATITGEAIESDVIRTLPPHRAAGAA